MDLANSLADVLYRLGFQNAGDLAASDWLSAAELYQFSDDLVKKLTSELGLFVIYDTSITVIAGTASYNLPASHVFTLYVLLAGTPLRLTPVRDLWALDGTWNATSGPAKRASLDAGSVGTITLYPNPTVGGTLAQVCQMFPTAIDSGHTTISLPTVLQDLFSYAMMAGARGKESDSAMPEMAAHFQERVKLYEQVAEHLWGPGQ